MKLILRLPAHHNSVVRVPENYLVPGRNCQLPCKLPFRRANQLARKPARLTSALQWKELQSRSGDCMREAKFGFQEEQGDTAEEAVGKSTGDRLPSKLRR